MKKYFIPSADRQGSCYYEFFAGPWTKMQFWHKDSICISDNDFYLTGLEDVIADVIPNYAPFAETEVTQQDWDAIMEKAIAKGGEVLVAAQEADEWAKQNFAHHKVFTILGL